MARERWRKVRRADGYKVSSLGGRVRSTDRTLSDGRQAGGVMLARYRDADGYWHVTINGEPVAVATLVLEAFDRPRPYGMEACHGRRGQDCNCAAELRWGSHKENERDKWKNAGRNGAAATCQFCIETAETGGQQC